MIRRITRLLALFLALWCVDAAAQTEPEQTPVAVSAIYTAEVWGDVEGGLRRGATYLDNLDLVANVDAEQAIGLRRTTAQVSLLYNNRNTFSEKYAGDLQTVSNIDTDGSLRLYEAWLEHNFGNGALKVGLIDLNSEFDVNEVGALFLNSSHGIGPEFAQVGSNGPGIFPAPALGGRLELGRGIGRLRIGAFEGTPGDPSHPRRTVLRLELGEGLLTAAEIALQPRYIRLKLGGWRHSGSPRDGLRKASGWYGIAEGRLAGDDTQALSGFLRIGFARGASYQLASYQGAGMTFRGPMIGGADEQFGLAIASARNKAGFRHAQAAAGNRVTPRETALEATYRTQLAPWLALQPDIQYIIHRGTDPALRNALAFGLRVEIGWTWRR